MQSGDEWSPDDNEGTETFRQGDVAADEDERLSGTFHEDLEIDPSLDPSLVADELELEELGSQLDDPELIVTLEGGIDDPDGIDRSARIPRDEGGEGWDLNAPLGAGDGDDQDEPERS